MPNAWVAPSLACLGGAAVCTGLFRASVLTGPTSRLARVLPDAALAPMVATVPPLFAAHVLIARRCKTLQRFEEMRASPLVLSLTGFGLGVVATTAAVIVARQGGLAAVFSTRRDTGHLAFGLFLGSLSLYHFAEFATVARYNPEILNIDSFLVNQKAYLGAMTVAMCEYFVEDRLFPIIKGLACFRLLGLAGMAFGEFFRKGALVQAQHNFTHKIADTNNKLDKHQLVTHGFYSFSRHPGYFGWFWWSVSTQILLCNPLSAMGFAYIAFKFFKDRIPYEEYFLCRYFPDYPAYRTRVPTRIPGIP